MYPIELANHFRRVITAEPEATNFRCLQLNAARHPNIDTHRVAFFSEEGECAMSGWDKNTGCFRRTEGRGITAMAIDDLGVMDCDFLQLDIEGSERAAIIGATRTIKRCHPVIMVERRSHGPDPHDCLLGFGYAERASSDTDSVYVFED